MDSSSLCSQLHLSGFEDVSMDEIKSFHNGVLKHQVIGHTGIDATTGPLGLKVSTATGLPRQNVS